MPNFKLSFFQYFRVLCQFFKLNTSYPDKIRDVECVTHFLMMFSTIKNDPVTDWNFKTLILPPNNRNRIASSKENTIRNLKFLPQTNSQLKLGSTYIPDIFQS